MGASAALGGPPRRAGIATGASRLNRSRLVAHAGSSSGPSRSGSSPGSWGAAALPLTTPPPACPRSPRISTAAAQPGSPAQPRPRWPRRKQTKHPATSGRGPDGRQAGGVSAPRACAAGAPARPPSPATSPAVWVLQPDRPRRPRHPLHPCQLARSRASALDCSGDLVEKRGRHVPGEAAVGLSTPDHEVADHGTLGLVDHQELRVPQLHLVQARGEAEHSAVVERVERGGATDGLGDAADAAPPVVERVDVAAAPRAAAWSARKWGRREEQCLLVPRRRAVPAARRRLICQGPLSHLPMAGAPAAARRATLGHRALVRSRSTSALTTRWRRAAFTPPSAMSESGERPCSGGSRAFHMGPVSLGSQPPAECSSKPRAGPVHICPSAAPARRFAPRARLLEPSPPLARVDSLPGPTFEGGPGVISHRCSPARSGRPPARPPRRASPSAALRCTQSAISPVQIPVGRARVSTPLPLPRPLPRSGPGLGAPGQRGSPRARSGSPARCPRTRAGRRAVPRGRVSPRHRGVASTTRAPDRSSRALSPRRHHSWVARTTSTLLATPLPSIESPRRPGPPASSSHPSPAAAAASSTRHPAMTTWSPRERRAGRGF